MEKQRAMEEALRIRSDHHHQQHRSHRIDEEEKRLIDSDHDHAHDNKEDHETVVKTIGNKRPYNESNDGNPSSPKQKPHLSSTKQEPVVVSHMEKSTMEFDHTKASSSCQKKEQDDQLESARAEMGEVREENQRLKIYLDRIMREYKTLQMQFYDIVQQEAKKPTTDHSSNDQHQEMEEEEPSDDLVSLSLGRSSSDSKRNEDQKNKTTPSHDDQDKGLSLGLDYRKFEASKSSDATKPLPNLSLENSSEDQAPKEDAGETWPPSKVLKMMKSSGEDEILQQNAVKKARVSVRARCDTPTMNDGCQWRKYGQKISKGNPCPRAYYRCTVAPSCPVRKQVQRCAEDMSILITTYEGNHNHPLPVSATAMASTTSAAASMLLSGPSSSSHSASSTSANLHGLNFYLSDNSKTKQFYLPNSSLSASSHPTITLDLTTAPSSSSSSHLSRFATANYPQNQRYNSSTTSLNFGSSSEISNNNNSMSWGSTSGLLSYGGTTTHPFIKNQIGSLNLARQQQQQQPPMENNVIYQSYIQQQPPKNNLPDHIAAATKAITADPSFQSALAAALTSIIGGGGGGSSGGGANHLIGGGDNNNNNFGQKLKWGDQQFPLASGYSSSQAVLKSSNTNIGCGPSFLNKSSTTTNSTQPGSMIFQQPAASLPFSTSNKSASSSPGDHKEQSH